MSHYAILATMALLTFVPAASAQVLYGSLVGNVKDGTGAAVTDADIIIHDAGTGRPNIVPAVSIYPAGGPTFAQWLNPAAFAIPARGTWGNAGRAIATAPHAASGKQRHRRQRMRTRGSS